MGGYVVIDKNRGQITDPSTIIKAMKHHPNYEKPIPKDGESKTAFILRSVAHLISPPQEPGESYDLECVTIASAVMALEEELETIWNEYHGK